MSEIKIKVCISELIGIARKHFQVPEDTPCQLEVIAYDTSEYPGNCENEMQFRISDHAIVGESGGEGDPEGVCTFEYNFEFKHKDREENSSLIEKIRRDLSKDGTIKNFYDSF